MPVYCGREGEEGCLCGVAGRGRRDAYVVWPGGGGGMVHAIPNRLMINIRKQI